MRDSLALEEAVRSYSSAYLRGDGQKAYDMLSARCRTAIDRGRLQQLSETATTLYGQARLVSVMPQVDGDRATVTYRFDQPAIDQEDEPWLREDGAWHYDEC